MSSQFSADLVGKTIQSQTVAVVVVATLVLLVYGQHAALSVVLGGLSVLVGTWLGTQIAKRGSGLTNGSAALINLLKAEAVKIGTIIILLWLTFKLYTALVPLALIAGLATAAIFSAVALSRIKI